jgi:hypothetical protein
VSHSSPGTAAPSRPTAFARHARAALEKHLPEARSTGAHWHIGANVAWVRYPRADGLFEYMALRRHLDWVTGETGVSRAPRALGDLFRLPGTPPRDLDGVRIRLGELLEGEDRWWPAGGSEEEILTNLDTLALQLAVKGRAHFRRWPGEGR